MSLTVACRAAAPACVEPLWITITHAPDQVFLDLRDLLARELPAPEARLRALLAWLGHGSAEAARCPICWMLVGRLVFTVPEPIARLRGLLEAEPDEGLVGAAALFLGHMLEPRHALPAGVDRPALGALLDAVRGFPPALQAPLHAHWERAGRERALLARRFE
ncbi:MAG: hypothetical protein R3F62_15295 [Planctomycetota bacterium]